MSLGSHVSTTRYPFGFLRISTSTRLATESSARLEKHPSLGIPIICTVLSFIVISWIVYKLCGKEKKNISIFNEQWLEDFWDPTLRCCSSCTECMCSICLVEVFGDEEIGKARCCNSWFHRDCIEKYWCSIETQQCPNCRFTLSIQ
jgi:hypothetical protein